MDLEIVWSIVFLVKAILSVMWFIRFYKFYKQDVANVVIKIFAILAYVGVTFIVCCIIGLYSFFGSEDYHIFTLLILEYIWGIILISALVGCIFLFKGLFLHMKEDISRDLAKKEFIQIIGISFLCAVLMTILFMYYDL